MRILVLFLFFNLCIPFFNKMYAQSNYAENDSIDYYASLSSFWEMDIITASKHKEKLSEAPATVIVIKEEQIFERGYMNLEELLEDIPEIEIQKKSVAELSSEITIRGVTGNEKFIIMRDGIRANAQIGMPSPVKQNYSLVNVKRVEIILGPGSALYGVDAFSGVINLITHTGKEINGGDLTMSYGSYNTTDNSIVIGLGNDEFSFVADGSFYHSDEPFMPDYYPEDYRWYTEEYSQNGNALLFSGDTVHTGDPKPYAAPTDAYSADIKLNFKEVSVGYSRNNETHSSSTVMRPEYGLYVKDAKISTTLESVYLKHDYFSKNGKVELQSTLTGSSFLIDTESKFVNTVNAYHDGYKFADAKSLLWQEQFGYIFNDVHSIIIGGAYQDILALAYSSDLPREFDADLSADLQELAYLGSDILDTAGNDLSILQDFHYIHMKNYSGFMQYKIRPSGSFNFTLGSRYDYNTRYGQTINPRLGVVYSPNKKVNVKMLYGQAFIAPAPYKAYRHFGSFLPNDELNPTGLRSEFFHLPNPELLPEKISTFELNLTYFLRPNLQVYMNGYYNEMTDLIVTEKLKNQEFKGVNIDNVNKPLNKGSAYTYGGTMRLRHQYVLNDESRVESYIAYSYSNGDIDGAPLSYSAPHTIKGGIDFKYKRFSISPRFIVRSPSLHKNERDENGDLASNESYYVVNLFTRYILTKKEGKMRTSIFLKISNLTDNRYYNVSASGFETFVQSPQDPIRITGGLTIGY